MRNEKYRRHQSGGIGVSGHGVSAQNDGIGVKTKMRWRENKHRAAAREKWRIAGVTKRRRGASRNEKRTASALAARGISRAAAALAGGCVACVERGRKHQAAAKGGVEDGYGSKWQLNIVARVLRFRAHTQW